MSKIVVPQTHLVAVNMAGSGDHDLALQQDYRCSYGIHFLYQLQKILMLWRAFHVKNHRGMPHCVPMYTKEMTSAA